MFCFFFREKDVSKTDKFGRGLTKIKQGVFGSKEEGIIETTDTGYVSGVRKNDYKQISNVELTDVTIFMNVTFPPGTTYLKEIDFAVVKNPTD